MDIYDPDGNAYIVVCNSEGDMDLLDARKGTLLSRLNFGANIEASPAVFNDMLVVGTRGQEIVGVKIS